VYGFNYIDTEVTLRFDNRNILSKKENYHIEDIVDNSNLPYVALGSAFSNTRFHSDVNIKDEKADDLWIEYLKNYKPSKNKKMFVAYDNINAVGVILVNIEPRIKEAMLFFVAVVPLHQSQGVGRIMINYVLRFLKKNDIDVIKTETQVKNINAINYYIKNGFSIIDKVSTILHRWDNG
jgi:ribosomal protein S18 acetylase RimI-like enzyme